MPIRWKTILKAKRQHKKDGHHRQRHYFQQEARLETNEKNDKNFIRFPSRYANNGFDYEGHHTRYPEHDKQRYGSRKKRAEIRNKEIDYKQEQLIC